MESNLELKLISRTYHCATKQSRSLRESKSAALLHNKKKSSNRKENYSWKVFFKEVNEKYRIHINLLT